MTRSPVLWLLWALLMACDVRDRTRDEAQALLSSLQRLDVAAPAAVRNADLERVRTLPIADKELRSLRSLCLTAHQGLIEVQVLQAESRAAMASAAQQPQRRPAQLEAAKAALEEAEQTLTRARAASDSCHVALRAAAQRYR